MVLRIVSLAALAVLCSGCATVSMQPASTTASIIRPKSDLQRMAEGYSDQAREAGWVEGNDPMAFLTRSLFPDAQSGIASHEYHERIDADTASIPQVQLQLQNDVSSALTGLTALNAAASDFLSDGSEIVRSDVASFEDALITSRNARRSFIEASEVLAERDATVSVETANDLDSLESEIEHTRQLADQLVNAWRDESVATS